MLSVKLNLPQSINLRFFLFCKILKASFLKPLDIIISKKTLFSSNANFLEIIELIATTPPNALIGSHFREFLNEINWFFSFCVLKLNDSNIYKESIFNQCSDKDEDQTNARQR